MRATFEVLNKLVDQGVIERYAVGGAVAAIFYMEPFATEDLDIFVVLPTTAGGLPTLTPTYDALKEMGYSEDRECLVVEEVAVQFLPAYKPLVEEALKEASFVEYDGAQTWILLPEYLGAIMLDTGRPKDKQRFSGFLTQAPIDKVRFEEILNRFGLFQRYQQWMS